MHVREAFPLQMPAGPSVKVDPAGSGIFQPTFWESFLPSERGPFGWEGPGSIYFYRVPISYRDLLLAMDNMYQYQYIMSAPFVDEQVYVPDVAFFRSLTELVRSNCRARGCWKGWESYPKTSRNS